MNDGADIPDPSTLTLTIARLEEPGPRRVEVEDTLVREEPLELRLRDHAIAVLMRTPGHDEELACGFAVTEGLVPHARDVRFASHCRRVPAEQHGNVINVMIPDRLDLGDTLESLRRNMFAGSSCGVCGKSTLDAVFVRAPALPRLTHAVRPAQVRAALAQMRAAQVLFDATGGLHAAGLYNLKTDKLIAVREDIGRHNAVDKVIGRQVLRRALPLSDHLLVVSGRIGFEIAQKALIAGVPAMAAISAPSSMAVHLAQRAGMLMLGFVRADKINVYSGADKIDPLPSDTQRT